MTIIGEELRVETLKTRVKSHWESEVCGSRYGDPSLDRVAIFNQMDAARYSQEYMLCDFARFSEARGLRVLEVGLGVGADFLNWVHAGAIASGRDLTTASVELVRERLGLEGLTADVEVGDAEALDLPDSNFDLYYSWGVLHHTPDTEAAIAEAHRVLKPGGVIKIMLYHWPSVSAVLVWLAHGPLRGRLVHPRGVVAQHVESPGTKLFTKREAIELIRRHFGDVPVDVCTHLGAGDLLTHQLSSRYRGRLWRILQACYPRWFVLHVVGHRFGTALTIRAVKSQ